MNESELVIAKRQADAGVVYSPQFGAICPACSTYRAKVVNSLPWKDNLKIRYHSCANITCTLHKLNITIKSVEVDTSLHVED